MCVCLCVSLRSWAPGLIYQHWVEKVLNSVVPKQFKCL